MTIFNEVVGTLEKMLNRSVIVKMQLYQHPGYRFFYYIIEDILEHVVDPDYAFEVLKTG